ncbi:aldehyde dehydrogenase family protein [Blastococcus brunescens]|uniref:Aldehyde dehydrogenase family protein n=1 Tax=Blastococcus brunescens TaxID=1564165 RepID=A0ABZ1AWU1_9ACTN|nr:aldehyde dehydrogenase family protein [Blastococcus sp. BMG 8361]WRL62975.1 aldehyde dehydrogenase family protein [Blastococcus sp. BMG 8361]
MSSDRLAVRKTYKLYVNGAFPRSESGRTYEVTDSKGHFLANAAWASRKDTRDAVVAARAAFPAWSAATAYNRGQVLYRVAEVMEGRHVQFCEEVAAGEGLSASKARAAVDAAIDRWVWYAGWTDKLAAVLGGANPVAGPYFDFSMPEPTGVVAVLAPQQSSLLGLVSVLAPVLATGSTAVVVTSKERPLPAVTLAEVLATSDVPKGAVNLLTGDAAELGTWLAEHADVDAIDLTGAPAGRAMEFEREAAGTVKRVLRPRRPSRTGRRTPACPGCRRSSRPRPCGIRSASDSLPAGLPASLASDGSRRVLLLAPDRGAAVHAAPEPGRAFHGGPGRMGPWPGPASSRSHSPSMTAPATRCGLRRGRRTGRNGRRSSARPRTRLRKSTSSRPPRRSPRSAGAAPTTTSPTIRCGRSWPDSVPPT